MKKTPQPSLHNGRCRSRLTFLFSALQFFKIPPLLFCKHRSVLLYDKFITIDMYRYLFAAVEHDFVGEKIEQL